VAAEDEQSLIAWTRALAQVGALNVAAYPEAQDWRYSSVADLIMDWGRLFTPSERPVAERGELGKCYRNASEHADRHASGVYVEGLAMTANTFGIQFEHAWCAHQDIAVDPTWTDGVAYLGVPFTADFRLDRQLQTGQWALLWTNGVQDLLRDGIPDDGLVDVGRPLPSTDQVQ
jgi:hypothetical protein